MFGLRGLDILLIIGIFNLIKVPSDKYTSLPPDTLSINILCILYSALLLDNKIENGSNGVFSCNSKLISSYIDFIFSYSSPFGMFIFNPNSLASLLFIV